MLPHESLAGLHGLTSAWATGRWAPYSVRCKPGTITKPVSSVSFCLPSMKRWARWLYVRGCGSGVSAMGLGMLFIHMQGLFFCVFFVGM